MFGPSHDIWERRTSTYAQICESLPFSLLLCLFMSCVMCWLVVINLLATVNFSHFSKFVLPAFTWNFLALISSQRPKPSFDKWIEFQPHCLPIECKLKGDYLYYSTNELPEFIGQHVWKAGETMAKWIVMPQKASFSAIFRNSTGEWMGFNLMNTVYHFLKLLSLYISCFEY